MFVVLLFSLDMLHERAESIGCTLSNPRLTNGSPGFISHFGKSVKYVHYMKTKTCMMGRRTNATYHVLLLHIFYT